MSADVDGTPPDLAGLTCEAFVLQPYLFEGTTVDPANVAFLKFAGRWTRLYLDLGIVFWRNDASGPTDNSDAGEGASFPMVDLGAEAAVVGARLEDYAMAWSDTEATVTFRFVGGGRIVIAYDYAADITRATFEQA